MQEDGNDILILFIASTTLIVLILILAFMFLLAYQKKVVSQQIVIQKSENDLNKKLLEASITAQENERKRIASDLHDDIGSLLSALKINVQHLKTVDQIGEPERAFLETTHTMLNDGIANVRRISYDLLPPTLLRYGLWEAITELGKYIDQGQNVSVSTDFDSVHNLRLGEKAELSIFRVIQELIANSLHHSKATNISVRCDVNKDLMIYYEDNGPGFSDASQLNGLGILNMQRRIEALNGKMTLSSIEDNHFFALLQIPKTNEDS
jgi:signal transduction histidine kinase